MKQQVNTIRFYALVASASLFGIGFSQGFELRAGAGATQVGNEFRVAQGASFEVEIWMTGNAGAVINAYSVALAMDRTNGAGTTASCLDNKLNTVSYVNHIAGFGELLSSNELRSAAVTMGTGNNYGYAGGALRPFVSYSVFGNLGGSITLGADALHIGTATISTVGLGAGIYGDGANEAGLFLADQGDIGGTNKSPQNGSSGYVGVSGSDSRRLGSGKYIVTTVPEPATMMAIAAGLAALAARRRRS